MPRTLTHTTLVLASLCMGLLSTILPASARPAGGNGTGVNTSLNFSYTQCGDPGQLRARFRATPGNNGTWQIQATFREQNVNMFSPCFGCPAGISSCHAVQGTASATVTATTGVPIAFDASGLQASGAAVAVTCSLTVNALGVVSVQQIFLHWA